MVIAEPLKIANPEVLVNIKIAQQRYQIGERSFLRMRESLGIPSPGRLAPFEARQVGYMDACWVAQKLPGVSLPRKRFKELWQNYLQIPWQRRIFKIYQEVFGVDIEKILKNSSSEFQLTPPVQNILQLLQQQREV